MNVLLITPLYSQHFDAGHFWLRALNQLGHTTTVWDYRLDVDPPPFFHWPEVTLVLKGESIDPRKLPSPKVVYWPDAFERTPEIEDVLQHYDKVFTPVRPTPEWMEWFPTGFDPDIHKDLRLPRDVDTIYIGTNNSRYKEEIVGGISPSWLFGNGWEGISSRIGPVYLHDLVSVLNRGKILIDVHQSPRVGLNRKFFECISCGFTIVDRAPGMEEILGKELADLVSFKSSEEAKELIEHYLEKPKEREEIWRLQREKIQDYTYERTLERILSHLK